MPEFIKKIIGLCIVLFMLTLGLFLIYRATAKDYTIVTGKVINKTFDVYYDRKGREHHRMIFQLDNLSYLIALNLDIPRSSPNAVSIDLLDIGRTYNFCLDATIPIRNNIKNGIVEIKFKGIQLFKANNYLDLALGIFMLIVSILCIILAVKHHRKVTAVNTG